MGGTQDSRRLTAAEIATIWLLLLGGIALPVVGWIAGAVLLWRSKTWTRHEKLIGTFVLPGGLMLPAYLTGLGQSAKTCAGSGGPGLPTQSACHGGGTAASVTLAISLVAVLAIAQIVSSLMLYQQARRSYPRHSLVHA